MAKMTKKNLNKRKKTRLAKKTLSPEEIQEKIQKRAYELYAKRGFAHGNDCADWLEAERLVKSSKY